MFRSRLPNFATAVVAIVLSIFNESAHARNVSNVLIYSHTVGFRHDSIPAAVAAMTERGPSYGINFVNTEDPSRFNDAYLSQFDALFFLHTTGDVLDEEGQEAFQNYLDNGGNFVAAHAAANCLPESTVFEATLGSQFAYHPQFQNATYVVERPDHPSTVGLPARWRVPDEVYNFVNDPRRHGAVVVLSVDEDSYEDDGERSPSQGTPHPIAWYQERLKGTNATGLVGRSWYTGLGHSNASWHDETFMGHVMGGITWALASNTTRAVNPSATVGSLGPSYTPPPPAPTVSIHIEGDGINAGSHRLSTIGGHSCVLGGLSAVGVAVLLSSLWVLQAL